MTDDKIKTGIPFVDGPLNKMDLNKDGKADVPQIMELVRKYQPVLEQATPLFLTFIDHGGLESLIALLSPALKKPALEALEALNELRKKEASGGVASHGSAP